MRKRLERIPERRICEAGRVIGQADSWYWFARKLRAMKGNLEKFNKRNRPIPTVFILRRNEFSDILRA